MEKLKMHSPDLTKENIARLAELFPNLVTESKANDGTVNKAIDFDLLRQELCDYLVDGPRERYQLNWPGKSEALLAANSPVAKTFRPCRADSLEFESTENLFIEGDNLDALKLLQQSFLNRVKFVYIDPPYNTGNEFIYDDNFSDDTETYFRRSNQKDNSGNRLIQNTESNGRFHSDWLSMIYPRLRLARNLLREDGVIFISIDDHEAASLKRLCDEVFGEHNFIATISRMMKSGGAKGRFFTPNIDFILVYAKDKLATAPFRTAIAKEQIDTYYNKIQREGPRKGERYGEERIFKASLDPRPNQRYWIECPDGEFVIPPGPTLPEKIANGEKVLPTAQDKVWKWTFDRYKHEFEAGNIIFKETTTSGLINSRGKQSKWNLYNKLWLSEQQEKGKVPSNFIGEFENRQSSAELAQLGIPFDYAKPVRLVKHLLQLARTQSNDIIVDFFAGSSTTAHAVMALNAEDGARRRYIMIQLPEKIDSETEAFKAGYRTITDLSKDRIRRAGKKIREENATTFPDLDIGFRVLKIDTSNMKDVYYAPDDVKQGDLLEQIENIKEDRNLEDLLFQVLLDWGMDLSLPIAEETISGKTVFFVDENALAACFDTDINEELVKTLAARKPLRAVFRDSGYGNDSVKINVEQIFKLISPSTEVKSL